MSPRALRVGVTGKFGSGKTTLMERLSSKGIVAIHTDPLAKELMSKLPLKDKLIGLLGPEIFNDGKLDTSRIASLIFGSRELRMAVEAIVHPAVTQRIMHSFESHGEWEVVAVESALILQTSLWQIFDYIILVESKDETIIERLRNTKKYSEADITSRLREQQYSATDLSEVDFTIENNSTESEFLSRCEFFSNMLLSLAMRELPEKPLHQLELVIPQATKEEEL